MAAMAQEPDDIKDMEAFLKMAKYPLVKHTDMTTEMREEAMDTCITAVEKHHADMEKCTQVSAKSGSADSESCTCYSTVCLCNVAVTAGHACR